MLLALLAGHTTQTIHYLDTNHMDMSDHQFTFNMTSLQKRSRPGKHLTPIEIKAFDHEPSLYIILHLKAYIAKTSVHREDISRSQLLLFSKTL